MLLLAKDYALGGKGLVLHSVEAAGNLADLSMRRVVCLDGGCVGWSDAVCAKADRGAVLRTGDRVSRHVWSLFGAL